MNAPADAFLVDFHDRSPGGSSLALTGLPVIDAGGRWRDSPCHALAVIPCSPLPSLQRLSQDLAWAWFAGMYDLHLLPPAAWPAIEAPFRSRLPALCDADGLVALPHSYFLIDATAAS